MATLLDTRRGTRIDHQVVQYKRYPHYPDLNVVTLSTKAPTITATVKQLQDAIENPVSYTHLPESMTAQLIQASDTGKLYTLEPDVYVYEVPCRLQYIQEA